MAAQSPLSSPRLPSPPPIAEDQIGPASPGIALFSEHDKIPGNALDTSASRRIRPGTRAEDMAEGPPLVDLGEIDSAFPLTEHLKALHHHHTHSPSATKPITAETARILTRPPPNTSKEIWLYELARFLIQKTNLVITALFSDNPPCSPQTCAEMRASEWQYLCAVHDPPKSCAAIDYCCHTLDWAATMLTSSKMFPSRLGLGGQGGGGTGGSDKVLMQQMKELTNIFRRVYRIYAHAWFQHREMFWRVEGNTGLYVLFKTVCEEYGLIQAENYTISSEAEGLEPPEKGQQEQQQQQPAMQVLQRPRQGEEEPVGNSVVAGGETTKRHRHTASDLSLASSVTTVIQEEAEEEEETEQRKPDLQRQATELRNFAESLPQPGQQPQVKEEGEGEEQPMVKTGFEEVADVEADPQKTVEVEEPSEKLTEAHEEPAPEETELGIARSDTLKPAQQEAAEAGKEESAEEVGEGAEEDETVIEVTPVEPSLEGEKPEEEKTGSVEATVKEEVPEAKADEPAEEPAKPEAAGESVAD